MEVALSVAQARGRTGQEGTLLRLYVQRFLYRGSGRMARRRMEGYPRDAQCNIPDTNEADRAYRRPPTRRMGLRIPKCMARRKRRTETIFLSARSSAGDPLCS